MLKRLRWHLTLIYTMVALGLVILIGLGSFTLLQYYFQRETDLALQYKMSLEFRRYGLQPPLQLLQAEQNWQAINPHPASGSANAQSFTIPGQSAPEEAHEEGDEEGTPPGEVSLSNQLTRPYHIEEEFDPELASIYVLPMDAGGQIISNTNAVIPPFDRDESAIQAALARGNDLRTISLADGTRVRLLTYRTSSPIGPVLLQMGRTLTDQERVLRSFLMGLFLLGGASTVLLGFGSWWLSGRSLGPAQRAWDQQQVFISNASHELRTPLTLIRASAEVGLRSPVEGEQKALLEDILGETEYMNRLVDDLLLLSRLDSHRLRLERQIISLPDLLTDVFHQAQKLCSEKGIELELGEISGKVWGDRTRLRQILLILLDNAIRFTPSNGRIHLETSKLQKMYQITVADNGQGIAPHHLPHVFERFYHVDHYADDHVRNNGLGLSIAKGLIEAQGGQIRIESEPTKGTRVIFALPAAEHVAG